MSKIRSKNTDIEVALQDALKRIRYLFSINRNYSVNRTFSFLQKLLYFVIALSGTVEIGLNLEKSLTQGYWREHIKRNIERDRFVNAQLQAQGFIVLRFWDYQIKKEIDFCIGRIKQAQNKFPNDFDMESTKSV